MRTIATSKINSSYTIKKNELIFGGEYKEFESIGSVGELEWLEYDYMEVDKDEVVDFIKELKEDLRGAYAVLDSNLETIQYFIDKVDNRLFGGEVYNGWLYLEDVQYGLEEGETEEGLTMETLLYIISKIECFLDYMLLVDWSREYLHITPVTIEQLDMVEVEYKSFNI
tara:strand:+ start:207 stop:713 length:507 start_codon:yes stop_codon:yes gene_type:complete